MFTNTINYIILNIIFKLILINIIILSDILYLIYQFILNKLIEIENLCFQTHGQWLPRGRGLQRAGEGVWVSRCKSLYRVDKQQGPTVQHRKP